jgi:hypothetical protein
MQILLQKNKWRSFSFKLDLNEMHSIQLNLLKWYTFLEYVIIKAYINFINKVGGLLKRKILSIKKMCKFFYFILFFFKKKKKKKT